MKSLYVLGGQRKSSPLSRQEKRHFQKGVIVRVDPETGDAKVCAEHVSPPDVRAEEPAIIFKSCTLQGDRLYACTQTEVLIYSFPDFERVGYLSLPLFNDVHHVRPTANGTLLVVNTGLDMVLETTLEGEVVREWNVLGEDPWERFSRDVDYRKVASTKPHKAHPNHVFFLDEDIWVTRFEQKDAVCLTRPDGRIPIDIERPHDGLVHGDSVYFTTVDGHVVIADRTERRVKEVIDLNGIHDRSEALGWCRGLMVDGSKVWVGFSRLRPTKFKEAVSWVKHGFNSVGAYNTSPTHIACYDLAEKKCLDEIDVEPFGLNTIFSVFAESE